MTRTNVAAAVLAMFAGVVLLAQPATAGTNPGNPTVKLKLGTKLSTTAAGAGWAQRSDAAIEAAIAADNGDETAFGYSWLASAIAHQSAQGWDDPRAMTYLDKALAQRLPSGGFGLNYAWDAFGDGTVNPDTTTYTMSLYQVGEVELEAYQAGKVPYNDIVQILRAVYATPKIPVTVGLGLAYSNSPYDVQPGYVVHNVDQAIAMLLQDTINAGILWSEAQAKRWISSLQAQETAAYRPATYDWPVPDRVAGTERPGAQRHRHRGPDEQQPHARPPRSRLHDGQPARFQRSGRTRPARCLGLRGRRIVVPAVRRRRADADLLDLRLRRPVRTLGGAHRRVVLSATRFWPPPTLGSHRRTAPRRDRGSRQEVTKARDEGLLDGRGDRRVDLPREVVGVVHVGQQLAQVEPVDRPA